MHGLEGEGRRCNGVILRGTGTFLIILVGSGKLKTAWYTAAPSERPSRAEEVITWQARGSVHFFQDFF